jgi:protein required for attachment to host cells
MMKARVVVADQSEARYYELADSLHLIRKTMHPEAHLRDRQLVSDRPGRVFNHANPAGGRRGGVVHHATGGERTPRKVEAEKFAHQIIRELDADRLRGQFDRLVVVSGPEFLGLLRSSMPKGLQTAVVLEIEKDLVHSTDEIIRSYIPHSLGE